MSDSGGHNRHDETHVRQGFSASGGAVVRTGDVNFYGERFRPKQRKSLLELLHFPEIRNRESAIECEHDDTCTWLIDTPEYDTWRAEECSQPRHRMLWIKGKPGAGKSTMMKFAVKQSRQKSGNDLVLPHFFNARGTALEHSTEGMYRTLLCWLLKELPTDCLEELESQYQHHDERMPWHIPGLVEILETASKALADRPVTFYIDALDECPQNEIRDMLKVFRRIVRAGWSSGRQVRVCFASRPYPTITFTEATFLDFREQEGHLKDMRQYIDDELQIGISPLAEDIRRNVLGKAGGSFMWLTLVVRLLNIDSDGGHVDKLRQRLHDVPSGLRELYGHILKRYPDNHEALLACCQWLIFHDDDAVKYDGDYHAPASSVHQLWWAIRQKIDRDEKRTRRLYTTMSDEEMERLIVEISKGLVEVREDADGGRWPQFLHESVREFILSPNDLWHLCGAHDSDNFAALSHEALRDICLAVLESERPTVQTLIKTYGHTLPTSVILDMWANPHEGKLKRPLARYAAQFTIAHAEKAQKLGLDQTAFLGDLNQRCGPHFLERNGVSSTWRKGQVGVLHGVNRYIVAYGAVEIIQQTQLQPAQSAWSQGRPFGLTDEDGHTCLVTTAVRHGYVYATGDSMGALVRIYLRLRQRTPGLQNILGRLADKWDLSRNYHPLGLYPPLLYAATQYPILGNFLLLALAANDVVDPHIDYIEGLVGNKSSELNCMQDTEDWPYEFSCFLQMFYLFLDKRLPTLAITFGPEIILQWVDFALSLVDDVEEENVPFCRYTLVTIKSLVEARQSRP